jgi:hypothetical protein
MKTEKKLKRGLPDLSSLFLGEPQKLRCVDVVDIKKECLDAASPKLFSPTSHIICVSVVQVGNSPSAQQLTKIAFQLRPTFEENIILSMGGSEKHRKEWTELIDVGEPVMFSQSYGIQIHTINANVRYSSISASQYRDICHPRRGLESLTVNFEEKPTLIFLDGPLSLSLIDSAFWEVERASVQILDHVILMVEGNVDSLKKAYEWLRVFSPENPKMMCSLLVYGKQAEHLWELTYEKLYQMASKFLGQGLGFFGWAGDKDLHLNPDILLDYTKNPIQSYSKKRIWNILLHLNRTQ